MSGRTDLRQFSLANPLYAAASVAVYEVDGNFQRTATLAPVYAGLTGTQTIANPMTLDGTGKWQQPPYVDRPVVLVIGGGTVPQHETSVTGILDEWRGDWSPNTTYLTGQIIRDGAAGNSTGNLYIATESHISSSLWSADLPSGVWDIYVDATAVGLAVVDQAVDAAVEAANDLVDARVAEIAAGTGNVPAPTSGDVGMMLRAIGIGAGQFAWSPSVVEDLTNATSLGVVLMKAAAAGIARDAIGAAAQADLLAAIASAVLRDGSQGMQANLAMGGHRITGLGNASAPTDAAAFGQVPRFPTTGGTQSPGVGNAAILPAGGKWLWFVIKVASPDNTIIAADPIAGGYSDGGTTVAPAVAGRYYLFFRARFE